MEEDLIKKMYYNDLNLLENIPETEEYKTICEEIIDKSNYILENVEGKTKENFKEFLEIINIKQSIESEYNFKLGFKTAMKLIIEGLK